MNRDIWIRLALVLCSGWTACTAAPSPAQRIGPDRAFDFQHREGWLYYANLDDQQRLYRIRPDGSQRQKIAEPPHTILLGFDGPALFFGVFHFEDDDSHDATIDELHRIPAIGAPARKVADVSIPRGQPGFVAAGGFAYYNNGSPDDASATRLDLATGKTRVLFPAPIQQAQRGPKDSVFLSRQGQPAGIARWTPGTAAPVRILAEPVQEFVVAGNWIYYASDRDIAPSSRPRSGRLYRIPRTGGSPELLDPGGSFGLQVAAPWIYFTQGKGGALRRARLDGSQSETLREGKIFWPQLSKDWIYFTLGSPLESSGSKLCCIQPDGSALRVLAKSRARFVAAAAEWACFMAVNDNTLFRLAPHPPR
jgi:hypothetical protein